MKDAISKPSALYGCLSQHYNEQINVGHDLTADEEVSVLTNWNNGANHYELNAGRQDLADGVKAEIAIVEQYMPKQLSDEEVQQIVADTIQQVGATGKGDFGKVMGSDAKT